MSADPLQLTEELITIFSSKDDFEILSKTKTNYQQTTKLRKEQEDEVKEAIQGLTKLLERQKSRSNKFEDDTNLKKLEKLDAEKGVTLQQIEKMEEELKRLTTVIDENEKAVTDIEKKKSEAERTAEEIQAKVKYNFSLYTNISRIRWDYNCEGDQIKGFVASLNDVKPFCLDSKQNTKFFTVNYLWDLMEH